MAKKSEELNDKDLDAVQGGITSSGHSTTINVKKLGSLDGWSTSGGADDRPTEEVSTSDVGTK